MLVIKNTQSFHISANYCGNCRGCGCTNSDNLYEDEADDSDTNADFKAECISNITNSTVNKLSVKVLESWG